MSFAVRPTVIALLALAFLATPSLAQAPRYVRVKFSEGGRVHTTVGLPGEGLPSGLIRGSDRHARRQVVGLPANPDLNSSTSFYSCGGLRPDDRDLGHVTLRRSH